MATELVRLSTSEVKFFTTRIGRLIYMASDSLRRANDALDPVSPRDSQVAYMSAQLERTRESVQQALNCIRDLQAEESAAK